jgi:glucosyl-3-phosphoglycerate synthase
VTRGVPPRVVAVVAAYNEAGSIGRVVAALRAIRGLSEVVVSADGSTDSTVEEARAAGARVRVASRRMGKGGSLEAALDRAGPAEVFLLVDGDVGETAAECALLVEEVMGGRLDLAIGVLPPQAGGGLGTVRRMSATLIRALTGFSPRAPLSGQRALTGRALWACRPLARGFGVETAMTIDALRLGFRVGEVPVAMTHRPLGRGASGFVHRGRQGVDILRAVVPRTIGLR